jgi:hypothetical protein
LCFSGRTEDWKTEFSFIALYCADIYAQVIRDIPPTAKDFTPHSTLSFTFPQWTLGKLMRCVGKKYDMVSYLFNSLVD